MIYKCGLCGNEYDSVSARAKCEASCLEEREKAEAAARKKKLEEEKETRRKEIELKYKELVELVSSYCKDYGSLQIGEKRLFGDDNFPALSKFISGWWL